MNENIKFEIRADAFHRMTGYMAPGKDARYGPSHEERMIAYREWHDKYGDVVDAMFRAMDHIID